MTLEPKLIGGYDVGLETDVKPFALPEKAFPQLEDAYVWRSQVKRRDGFVGIGRLRRIFTTAASSTITLANPSPNTFNIYTLLSIAGQPNAQIEPGDIRTIVITINGQVLTDSTGTGVFVVSGAGANITSANINYNTGDITIAFSAPGGPYATTMTIGYYPALPVMGENLYEQPAVDEESTIGFDTVYAYSRISGAWQELPSTILTKWSGSDTQFFYSTNYWVDSSNNDLFWVTNNKPGFNGVAITAYGVPVAGPPSTDAVTAAGNALSPGDNIYIIDQSAMGNDNKFGTITVAGNPFTVSNPTGGYFTNIAPINATFISDNPAETMQGDGIRYYNGTRWFQFTPRIDQFNVLTGCLIILPFKNRLICLNTWELNTATSLNPTASVQFRQRCRFSQNGTPLILGTASDVDAWRIDKIGKGGFIDAPTNEAIVGAGFIKDKLIVYFERSAWELVYNNNETLPFYWQRINAELGSLATFSPIQFDNGLLAVGDVGVHLCSGVSVERIDAIIPDYIFSIHNVSNQIERVYGIRDFQRELVYWTIPQAQANLTYCNQVLVYNYRNETFATFNDTYTCYGYLQNTNDLTWSSLPYSAWEDWNDPWNSGPLAGGFRSVIAGNQQGFTFNLSIKNVSNDAALEIQGITVTGQIVNIKSVNHNLQIGQFVTINGIKLLNPADISILNGTSYEVQKIVDADNFTINETRVGTIVTTYIGGGTIQPLNNISIFSKFFTPYWTQGQRTNLSYIDFLFDNTENGEVTVNLYIDQNSDNSLNDDTVNGFAIPGVNTGSNIVSTAPEPDNNFQVTQDQIWHRLNSFVQAQSFAYEITLSNDQMLNSLVQNEDVVLHATILWVEPGAKFI